MTSQHESSIDRRLFLGAVGALTLLGQPALAQDGKSEAKPDAKADAVAKRLSDTIADFVVGFDPKSLPPLAVERARLAFIDTLAVMLAGSREEGSEIVCEMVRQEGAGSKVSVVGQSFRTSPQLAALANGVAAHIMDYDMSSLLGQPTSPIIPALLPLAESTGATPAEVTAAFIVGFEVCLKLARSAPEQSLVGGWHAGSSIGTIGAAMACARLLRVPPEHIADVLGIAHRRQISHVDRGCEVQHALCGGLYGALRGAYAQGLHGGGDRRREDQDAGPQGLGRDRSGIC